MAERDVIDDTERDLEQAEKEYFGPRFLARVHARLHLHPVSGAITKVVVTVAGVVVMVAGLVMMVTPGPGIVGLILGLAILSTEWRWADRWLDAARDAAKRAADKAREMDPAVRRRRIAVGVLAVLAVALVLSALINAYGWPNFAVSGWDWLQGLSGVVPELPGMAK